MRKLSLSGGVLAAAFVLLVPLVPASCGDDTLESADSGPDSTTVEDSSMPVQDTSVAQDSTTDSPTADSPTADSPTTTADGGVDSGSGDGATAPDSGSQVDSGAGPDADAALAADG